MRFCSAAQDASDMKGDVFAISMIFFFWMVACALFAAAFWAAAPPPPSPPLRLPAACGPAR
jgi:hypothetical protein